MAEQAEEFAAMTGRPVGELMARLAEVSAPGARVGAPELTALARLLRAPVEVYVLSAEGPELWRFDALPSEGAPPREALVLATVGNSGRVFWSTVLFAAPPAAPIAPPRFPRGAPDIEGFAERLAAPAAHATAAPTGGAGTGAAAAAARGAGGAGAGKGEAPEWQEEVARAQAGPTSFVSRFSPVFQKCVLSVEARLRADDPGGAALQAAWAICSKASAPACPPGCWNRARAIACALPRPLPRGRAERAARRSRSGHGGWTRGT
jgi:hypothetical protein